MLLCKKPRLYWITFFTTTCSTLRGQFGQRSGMWVCHHGMREIIYRTHKSHFTALCLKAESAWRALSAAQPDAPGLFSCPFEIINGSTQCRRKYQSPQPHIHKICEHRARVNLSSNYFLKHSYVLTFWKRMIWEPPSSPNLGEGKTFRWNFSLLWEKAAVSVPTRRFPRQITNTAEVTSLCLHLCFPLMFRILKTGRAGDEWLPRESD